ncbi:MAG: flagellar filament capping protein FliD [Vibrionaceae bacterium]
MAISATGSGSGIDINAMVKKIVESERAPKQARIDKGLATIETNLSAYGRLKSSLDSMKEIMADFRSNDIHAARRITSSQPEIISATTNKDAVSGTYQIEVKNLASSHKIVSDPIDPKEKLGAGALELSVAGRKMSVSIEEESSTLLDVVRLINSKSPNPGIKASVLNSDAGASLVLSAEKMGAKNTIAVQVDAALGSPLAQFSYAENGESGSAMRQLQAASDAAVVIDGLVSASSSTNSFQDAIQGITFEVNALSELNGEPLTLTVEEDRDRIKQELLQFVESYNSFYQVSRALTQYDPQAQEGGPLVGDSVVRTAVGQMRNLFSSPIKDADEALKTLSDLGIITTQDGMLEVDHVKLDRQLRQNFASLTPFFAGTDGFARKVEDVVRNFTGAAGAIRNRESTLSEQRLRLQKDQTTLDARLSDVETRTKKQFAAMDDAVGEMRSQLAAMTRMMPS